MAIYRIQRIYSDESKSGMGTLGKVALGTAAIGGGLAAAKFGMLGGAAQRTTNTWLLKAGKATGSQGMINSGAKGLAEGQYKGYVSGLKSGAEAGKAGFAERLKVAETDAGKEAFINRKTTAAQNKFKIETPAPAAATQAAFSEDTNATLREAALIGTGLTLATGGILLAKHGKLGKTAKGAYDRVSGKIEKVWKETTKKGGNEIKKEKYSVTEKAPGGSPKTSSSSSTTISTPKSPKITFSGPDWKEIKNYCKSNGLDFRNPKDIEKAAAALGIKPIK